MVIVGLARTVLAKPLERKVIGLPNDEARFVSALQKFL